MDTDVRDLLEFALDERLDVTSVETVSGGDISQAARVETPEERFFVKWLGDGPADLFEREAEALQTMRRSPVELKIPEVYGATGPGEGLPAVLVLEYIQRGRPGDDYDEKLGRGLARLHGASAESFGFDHDNYCGTTPQPNEWTDEWTAFYRDCRLGHLLELIDRRRGVSTRDRRRLEGLLDRLDEFVDDTVEPSLIHGDLWSGNVFADAEGEPALVDPAAYYGHPEAEIGMMELFGGFSPAVYDAYRRVRALPPGWRERIPVYSLYHLLNHHYLFGGHYGRRAFGVVDDLLGSAR